MSEALAATRRPRVLVVDDDAALVRMMRLSFLASGFEVLTAADGLKGLESLAASEPFDAIVLDLQMPRMDGRTFFVEVRARGCRTPIVILSAHGAEAARAELCAEAALRKPFDPDVLINAVRRLVAS